MKQTTLTADDVGLAAAIAESAGKLLVVARENMLLDSRALGAAGDALAHQWICRALGEYRPDDGLLSEEGETQAPARAGRSRVWIVDPLDGTREYTERRWDWAVHVALVVDGAPAAAAVALPALGVVYMTGDRQRRRPDASGPVRIAVSRSRPPAFARAAADAVAGELVPLGSAGFKAMAVLRGEADAYLHAGGQWEWDVAAPAGVAAHAGLHVSRIDGSALMFNQEQPELPDLLVCRPELRDELLAAVSAAEAA
jgi:3'(2'), 5'-bisphosphate nucleotidase